MLHPKLGGRPVPCAQSNKQRINTHARVVAGEDLVKKCKNRALCDTFLKFVVVIRQVMRFSKTTGYKLALHPGGRWLQNSKWPPVADKFLPSYRDGSGQEFF